MKYNYKSFLVFFFVWALTSNVNAQKRGVNYDPNPKGKGEKPYEMKNRKEVHPPLVTFEDCSRWLIKTKNAKADLYRSNDKPLFREYTGKLVYTPTARKSEIILYLENPVQLPEPWDCIDFWNYGDHWLWGEPDSKTAFNYYALVEDADGRVHELDFSQSGYRGLVHKYWFLSHIKQWKPIKSPAHFVGIKFSGKRAMVGKTFTIYLGPVYAYKEELKPLSFKHFPDSLPFPNRKETILPTNFEKDFKTSVKKNGTDFLFVYTDNNCKIQYELSPKDGLINSLTLKQGKQNISINQNGAVYFSNGHKADKWIIKNENIKNDTLFIDATALVENKEIPFLFWYTLKQKSFILGIQELANTGHVKKIDLGKIETKKSSKHLIIPFMIYAEGRIPLVTFSNDLFFSKHADWYVSDASEVFAGKNKLGVLYIPKTNGERNPVKEKFFITASPDLLEVLPNIPNPASPMKNVMGKRLWLIEGSADYAAIKDSVTKMRFLGLENVAVRFHEGFWRDNGESYTFKTTTAPKRGGDSAVRDLVHFIKNKDWLVGLYSNYTDLAPVNENWNPDWVKRGPHGEWEVSWSRCYTPKPMIAWEKEAENAPVIHRKFGSNFSYCDVHTAVSPISKVDYDYRVPGAATFRRTYECYGLLLLNERKSYHGPVFSEGKYHWMYAGLLDGNYGNFALNLTRIPVLPEFQLLKIHPLEMDAGNVNETGFKYLSYTLVYGHIGILPSFGNGSWEEKIRRYAVLQPLQSLYSMEPVKTIRYVNDDELFTSSEAVKKDLYRHPKLYIEYQNGLTMFLNFSKENWEVNHQKRSITLPPYGYLVYHDSTSTIAFYGKTNETSHDSSVYFSASSHQYYFNTNGDTLTTQNFSCSGNLFLKKENTGWEIIPATKFKFFAFNPAQLGYPEKVQIEGVDIHDLPVEEVSYQVKNGMIYFEPKNKKSLKYKITPL